MITIEEESICRDDHGILEPGDVILNPVVLYGDKSVPNRWGETKVPISQNRKLCVPWMENSACSSLIISPCEKLTRFALPDQEIFFFFFFFFFTLKGYQLRGK